MANSARLHVCLGEPDWSKHTYARADADAGLALLGSVSKGQQRGALVQKSDGIYIMLVGDYEMPLNQHQVRAALQSCKSRPAPVIWKAPRPNAIAPTVVFKKRRIISAIA